MKKPIISILLTLVICLVMLPMTALAAEPLTQISIKIFLIYSVKKKKILHPAVLWNPGRLQGFDDLS